MARSEIYARCTLTPSPTDHIITVVIKIASATMESASKDPEYAGMEIAPIVKDLFAKYIAPLVDPAPGAVGSIGGKLFPEGEMPIEINGKEPTGVEYGISYWIIKDSAG